jgi:S-formylglutathione hydrolase FrmB
MTGASWWRRVGAVVGAVIIWGTVVPVVQAEAARLPEPSSGRLIEIRTPTINVDTSKIVFNGPGGPLRAKVLLPDGYDSDPNRRWPVLFLLHGVTDRWDTWAHQGDIRDTAAGFPGIIVMPEGARGFYTNWWRGGGRANPGWERFFLDELIPQIERDFRIMPGRRWHAIGGVSMGGLGAAYLAGQAPDYFGSVASFSGFMNPDRLEVSLLFRTTVPEAAFRHVWGPKHGFYARGHDPTLIPWNLKHTRLFVTAGDGLPEPEARDSLANAVTRGLIEALIIVPHVRSFLHAVRGVGADVTWVPHHGIHEWSYYWRRALREAIAWDLFAPVPEDPAQWRYTTTSDHGGMWGLKYRFPAAPAGLVDFTQDGDVLRIDGPPGYVDLETRSGCHVRRAIPSIGPVDPLDQECQPSKPLAINR